MPYPSPLLSSLGNIAQEAGTIAVRIRRSDAGREIKPDGSIVTRADREVETWLRTQLPDLYPDTNVWGEEFGFASEGEGGLWLVDPIDGTSNFSYGSPLWGVSIALLREGRLEFAAIALPDLNEVYVAERERGAYVNGQRLPDIPAGPIQPFELVSCDNKLAQLGGEIPGKFRYSGAFVIDGAWVAKQRMRGLIGLREKLYDIAASVLIAEELGADIRYADGSEMKIADLVEDEKIPKPWIIFPRESGFYL